MTTIQTTTVGTKHSSFKIANYLNTVNERVNTEERNKRLEENVKPKDFFTVQFETKIKILTEAFSKTILNGNDDEIAVGVVKSAMTNLVENFIDVKAQYALIEDFFEASLRTGDFSVIEEETNDYAIFANSDINEVVKAMLKESFIEKDGLLFEIFRLKKAEQIEFEANEAESLSEEDDMVDSLNQKLGGISSEAIMETAISNVSLSVTLDSFNLQLKKDASQALFSEDIIEPLLSVNLLKNESE